MYHESCGFNGCFGASTRNEPTVFNTEQPKKYKIKNIIYILH
jgi:hypothetical protein